jgi:hypothetical protein
MEITVAMRAHRSLRSLSQYRSDTYAEGLLRDLPHHVSLHRDEAVVGFYENIPGSTDSGVLVTDQGLHVDRGGSWEFLPFCEMASVDLEGGEKSLDVDNLVIRLRNGESALVPFTGGNPALGTRDTFSAWTFLKNVLADAAKCKAKERGTTK